MIERKKIVLDLERKLITNMIISDAFLREIVPVLKPSNLKSQYTQLVARWVLDYYNEFNEAPKKNIQEIYLLKRKEIDDDEVIELIGTFLQNLSDEVPNNINFSVKQAIDYLKQRSLEITNEALKQAIQTNDLLEAENVIGNYSRIELLSIKGIDVLTDVDSIHEAFNTTDEVLFSMSGKLGEILGTFSRGDFVSYLAFAKRGKTTWLLSTAQEALRKENNVVFISLEMTQNQIIRRLWESFAGRPKEDKEIILPKFISLPIDMREDEKVWGVKFDTEFREGFPRDRKSIENEIVRLSRYLKRGKLKLITLPARSATVKDINNHLTNLMIYEDFVPDVIIIDYADLLSPTIKQEHRHQLDDIWAELRKMAVEWNSCLITVSQSNRGSANSDLSEESIAEDIRKIAHVTKMIGINQTRKEHKQGLYRLSLLAQREGLTIRDHVLCLSCLDIARPCLDSRMADEVLYEKGEYREVGKKQQNEDKKFR